MALGSLMSTAFKMWPKTSKRLFHYIERVFSTLKSGLSVWLDFGGSGSH